MNEAAQDIQEMMQAWEAINAAVRAQYPQASDETVYQIAKGTMNKILKFA